MKHVESRCISRVSLSLAWSDLGVNLLGCPLLGTFAAVLNVFSVVNDISGLHSGVLISTVTSQQEGCLFESWLFCVELPCFPCACVGSLWVLWPPPTVSEIIADVFHF